MVTIIGGDGTVMARMTDIYCGSLPVALWMTGMGEGKESSDIQKGECVYQ